MPRKDSFGYGMTLPPGTARLLDAGQSIQETPPDRLDFLHAILCQVGMPRRRQEARTFERRSGNVSLLIEGPAGYGLAVGLGYDVAGDQHGGVRLGAGYVLGVQPLVEIDGGVDPVHDLRRLAGKAAADVRLTRVGSQCSVPCGRCQKSIPNER